LEALPGEHMGNTQCAVATYFSVQRFTGAILLSAVRLFLRVARLMPSCSIAPLAPSQARDVVGVT